jgi:hypothetical protein
VPVPKSVLKLAGPLGSPLSLLATVRSAQRVLSAVFKLSAEDRAELAGETKELTAALGAFAGAMRSKLVHREGPGRLAWKDARDEGLHPTPEFDMAKRIVDAVREAHGREESLTTAELARAVQAVGDDDGTFRAGLRIAESDGYVDRSVTRHWRLTAFADPVLLDAPHVLAFEQMIVDHIESVGVADTDELALFVGAEDASAPEFVAALERALASGRVSWLGWSIYGLPPEQLERFEGAGPDLRPAASESDVAAAARKVAALTLDIRRKVAAREKGGASPKEAAPDPAERLRQLADLHSSGVINDDEFEQKKAELLALL